MDSHKVNMLAGGLIGSLLFFLLLGFFSDLIFVGRGHHDEPLAFAVEVEEAEGAGEVEMAVDWPALVAAADPAKGEKLYGKCKSCHQVADGANGVGPHLFGVVGRDIASVSGYSYSDTLTGMAGDWDLEALSGFLESPKGYAPGTKMGFAGLKKAEDRVALIVYLNEADGTPIELASAAPVEAAETATDATAETATAETVAETVVETVAETATEAAATVETATEAVAETATEAAAAVGTAAETAAGAATETATETVAAVTEAVSEPAAPADSGLAGLLASADAKAGKKVYRKCRACHSPDEGKNGVGPSLWGVVNRDIASIDGFNFSDAMSGMDGNWTGSRLFEFIENPTGVVPDTKMKFAGVKDAQDRANVILFLNENDGTPDPLE